MAPIHVYVKILHKKIKEIKENRQPNTDRIHAVCLSHRNGECLKKELDKNWVSLLLITRFIYSFIQQEKKSFCQGSKSSALKCKQYLH